MRVAVRVRARARARLTGAMRDDKRIPAGLMAWEKLQPTGVSPPARCGHTATLVDAKMFVYGGTPNELSTPLDDVFSLNISTFVSLRKKARSRARGCLVVSLRAPQLIGAPLFFGLSRLDRLEQAARRWHHAAGALVSLGQCVFRSNARLWRPWCQGGAQRCLGL